LRLSLQRRSNVVDLDDLRRAIQDERQPADYTRRLTSLVGVGNPQHAGHRSLAQEHLLKLGIPSAVDRDYTEEDAWAVLQGRTNDAAVADVIYGKLAWVVGVQLVGFINKELPKLQWTSDRILIRTLLDGESSARPMSFSDGSHVVLVSRALQESLICMANVLEYFDVTTGLARLSLRRRKRERLSFESSAHITAILRYLLLGQRMTGRMPTAPARLDRRSADIAGKMASGAVMFVVAHELAHIAHGHTDSSPTPYGLDGRVTVSELQELQADSWALNCLKKCMADDPAPENVALSCAFIALFATYITEQAIYVRRDRTYPEAWERWATLQKLADESDERTEKFRTAFMCAVMAAIKLDEPFPEHLWPLLPRNQAIRIEPAATNETLMRWDLLQTCPLDSLIAEAEQSATPDGRNVLKGLQSGEISVVFGKLVASERRRARMLDPTLGLEFATLRRVIDEAPGPLTNGDRALFSVAGARLAAQHLNNPSH
jgi:hypothetical protein